MCAKNHRSHQIEWLTFLQSNNLSPFAHTIPSICFYQVSTLSLKCHCHEAILIFFQLFLKFTVKTELGQLRTGNLNSTEQAFGRTVCDMSPSAYLFPKEITLSNSSLKLVPKSYHFYTKVCCLCECQAWLFQIPLGFWAIVQGPTPSNCSHTTSSWKNLGTYQYPWDIWIRELAFELTDKLKTKIVICLFKESSLCKD